jgi:GTP-binding protein
LTKADKLNRKEQSAILRQTQDLLASYVLTEQSDIGVALFSALKNQGVADAARQLHEWALNRTELPVVTELVPNGEPPTVDR